MPQTMIPLATINVDYEQPETDNARRWGLAYRRTRAERIEAANRGDHLLRAARDTIFNCEAHHDHSAT